SDWSWRRRRHVFSPRISIPDSSNWRWATVGGSSNLITREPVGRTASSARGFGHGLRPRGLSTLPAIGAPRHHGGTVVTDHSDQGMCGISGRERRDEATPPLGGWRTAGCAAAATVTPTNGPVGPARKRAGR